jgi:type IV secretory pathway VirB2 component (pilin)
MIRLLIGGFLIAHGLVHVAVWATPKPKGGGPFDPSHSWLIGSTKGLAALLAVVVAIVLIAGGVALFSHSALWRPLTVIGLAASLFLDALYFNPWFAFIAVLNAAFIATLIWTHWPSERMVGA